MASAVGQEPVERDFAVHNARHAGSASDRLHANHSMRVLTGKWLPVSCGAKRFWSSICCCFVLNVQFLLPYRFSCHIIRALKLMRRRRTRTFVFHGATNIGATPVCDVLENRHREALYSMNTWFPAIFQLPVVKQSVISPLL